MFTWTIVGCLEDADIVRNGALSVGAEAAALRGLLGE